MHRERHRGHQHAEDALERLHDPARPQAPAHAKALVGPVGELPAERAGEEIHQAVERSVQARLLRVRVRVRARVRVRG